MDDPKILASALAAAILFAFLLRFYRIHVRPGFTRDNWLRAVGGIAIIIASILLSVWWRRHM
jgi:hypothetical protein